MVYKFQLTVCYTELNGYGEQYHFDSYSKDFYCYFHEFPTKHEIQMRVSHWLYFRGFSDLIYHIPKYDLTSDGCDALGNYELRWRFE